jgi:hypothetical protein
VHAVVSVPFGNLSVQREAVGVKVYVAGSLSWAKVDGAGTLLGGATFEACRTHDRFGIDIPDECIHVLDDAPPDTVPVGGKFNLGNLKLGVWQLREITAPAGYVGDLQRIEVVNLTVEKKDLMITDAWVNRLPYQGILAPTETTCQDFASGTAADLTQVFYSIKGRTINNTAPGVFFYYTKVTAPGSSFTINIHQVNDQSFTSFEVQNIEQVRLYHIDCSTPGESFTTGYAGGQAWVTISNALPGQQFIVSVKYTTSSVVGQTAPNPSTVHYDFSTVLDGVIVDTDTDGLNLLRK